MYGKVRLVVVGLLTFFIVAMIVCFMAGCKTAQYSSVQGQIAVKVTDSNNVQVEAVVTVKASDSNSHERTVKDTAVGIRAVTVGAIVNEGTDTTVTNGHLTLKTYTDAKGRRHMECKADSLTIVIRNVTHERDFFKRGYDSLADRMIISNHSSTRDSTATLQSVVREKESQPWKIGLIAIVLILVLIGYLVERYNRR